MSYSDTHCVCGGRKDPETMLCDLCVRAFKDTYEFKMSADKANDTGHQRSCAIKLLAMARRRRPGFTRFHPFTK